MAAPHEEAHIPVDPLRPRCRLVNMMKAEDVVVDQTLNNVKNPKANQHRAGE